MIRVAIPDVVGSVYVPGLPLNGEVSDLDAEFWLRRVGGYLVLELDEIHVQ